MATAGDFSLPAGSTHGRCHGESAAKTVSGGGRRGFPGAVAGERDGCGEEEVVTWW